VRAARRPEDLLGRLLILLRAANPVLQAGSRRALAAEPKTFGKSPGGVFHVFVQRTAFLIPVSVRILAIGISPTGGLPGMACESSRTAGRKQEEDVRESGSSALQGRE
jgi:hypothetical protein